MLLAVFRILLLHRKPGNLEMLEKRCLFVLYSCEFLETKSTIRLNDLMLLVAVMPLSSANYLVTRVPQFFECEKPF